MPTRENTNFPRLSDPDEFESMIRDICALEWNDPHTEKFGRRGQKQYGVDIYGQPAGLSGKYRGAQCKLRTKDDQLTKSEIEAEVADACSFPHELETLIIITDAPRDTTVQILIDDISSREAARGGFRVAIWFWDNITERLAAHPKLIVRYYRDYFANLTVLRAAERLVDVPLQVIYSTTGSSAGTPLLKEALQMRGVRPLSPADGTVQASHLVEVGPDGVVCEYAEQTAGPIGSSLSTLAGEALSLSRQVESSTPIFVVLPRQVQTAFSESFEKLGGDIHRLEILSDNLSLDQRAERVLRAVFDLGHARRGGLSTIDIAVRTRENRPSSALLDVDWQARLSPEHFPAPSEWKDFFVPASD